MLPDLVLHSYMSPVSVPSAHCPSFLTSDLPTFSAFSKMSLGGEQQIFDSDLWSGLGEHTKVNVNKLEQFPHFFRRRQSWLSLGWRRPPKAPRSIRLHPRASRRSGSFTMLILWSISWRHSVKFVIVQRLSEVEDMWNFSPIWKQHTWWGTSKIQHRYYA